MFKRFLSLLLCLLLPLSMAACAQPAEQAAAPSPSAAPAVTQTPQPAAYTAGTYTGSGRGSNGDITVSVTCSDSQITGIEILEQDETYFIFMYPEEVIPARILEKQSLAVGHRCRRDPLQQRYPFRRRGRPHPGRGDLDALARSSGGGKGGDPDAGVRGVGCGRGFCRPIRRQPPGSRTA